MRRKDHPVKRAYLVCLFQFLATTLMLSQSNPIFAPAVAYGSGGLDPRSVAVADVNGDGKPDLVVVNWCADNNCTNGTVSVLLGNGDGTFQAAVSYGSGGLDAYSVAVGDVNKDGKLDLVLANECVSSSNCANGLVSVLVGNGDGTFQAAVSYGSGGSLALSVAVGDVNGDGKPDLVVTNFGSYTVSVLLGNGDGTFQTAVSYGSGGVNAWSVAVGDVNGDAKPDLVVTNLTGGVGVLLGNGDGTFQAAVSYGSGGVNAESVAVADVNGDGKPDLVVANACANSNCAAGAVSVLLGNGDGTFQAAVSYLSGGQGAESVAVEDVNRDGKPDLVVTNDYGANSNYAHGTVSVLLGNGDGTFQAAVGYGSGGDYTLSVAVGDVNGDGKPDVAAINFNSNTVGVLLSISSTTTAIASSSNPASYGQSVTFTATVVPKGGSGTPTGTVTFMDGATALGTGTLNASGVATFATSSLAVGQHSMTAVYSGDTNNAGSTSSVLTQTVNAANFTLTSNPPSTTVTAGHSGTFTVTVTPQGSFTSPISFTCTWLPTLAACGFSPTMVTPNTNTVTTTLTITTAAHTAAHAAALVPPPFGHRSSPLYAIWLVLPAMLLGTAGMAAPNRRKLLSYCLVFLLVGGCLLQVACAGTSNSGSGGGGGGGTGGTPAGTYTVTVTGAAGSTQHTTTVTLTVQ